MKATNFNVPLATAQRGQQRLLAEGATPGESAGVPVDGSVPLLETETGQRVAATKFYSLE